MSFFRNQILFRKKGYRNQRSYLFDGSNEYININAVRTALATTTVGTWSCWVKPVDATPAASNILICFGDTDVNERILMFITTAGLLNCFLTDATVNQWAVDTDAAVFSDNVWTHIGLVQDGVSPVLYVDGVAVAQTFYVTTNQTRWFNDTTGLDNGRLGCQNSNNAGNTGFFNGNIDEVRFWNRALSAAEILNDYNNGKPKAPNTDGLVAHFPFDGDPFDGTNFSVRDHIGNNHGATVNIEYDDLELDVP